MRFYIVPIVLLAACSNVDRKESSDGFYTWIDSRGMLHTEKKSRTPEAITEKEVSGHVIVRKADDGQVKVKKAVDIIKSEYMKSDDLDKKIAGNRLFSWNDNGRQVVAELGSSNLDLATQEIHEHTFSRALREFREGKEVLLTDIYSREIKLEYFYTTNKESNVDYLLIELNTPNIKSLNINSFVQTNKVALPFISFLNNEYQSTEVISEVFSTYTKETWSTYGKFNGLIRIPAEAMYILIRPNPSPGVIELSDEEITLIDLGVIQITD